MVNPTVCASVCLSVCLSAREYISGTAGPTKFCAQIACGCSSVLLRRRCATLFTSGFMDDATFRRTGPYDIAWPAERLLASVTCVTGAVSDCL